MRSDTPSICPDCGDTHYRTESCSPTPTPKLTAEKARRIMARKSGLCSETLNEVAAMAEIEWKTPWPRDRERHGDFCMFALKLRALAKEKPDEAAQ